MLLFPSIIISLQGHSETAGGSKHLHVHVEESEMGGGGGRWGENGVKYLNNADTMKE